MIVSSLLAAVVSLTPCEIAEVKGTARCGTVTVAEDRAQKASRQIALNTVILPARTNAAKSALFLLQGGPGQAVTRLADFYGETFDGIRDTHDLVLVDQRGTGKSNGLACDIGPGPGLFPKEIIAACAADAAARANLKLYTTREAVEDIEEIRKALGYGPIDLYGTSYGTRLAIEFIRKYPRSVRSASIKGVVPPQMRYTIDTVLATQASLDRVRRDCGCDIDVAKFAGAEDELGVVVRGMLQSPGGVARVPAFLRESDAAAVKKRFEQARQSYAKEISIGMYLSTVCSEDMWRITDDQASREIGKAIGGDFWHRELRAACAAWPHAAPNRTVAARFRSDVPVLIISGAYDSVTPPQWGDAAGELFSNHLHLKLPHASHNFGGLKGCVDHILSAFVRVPDPKKLDASCVATMPPIRFE